MQALAMEALTILLTETLFAAIPALSATGAPNAAEMKYPKI